MRSSESHHSLGGRSPKVQIKRKIQLIGSWFWSVRSFQHIALEHTLRYPPQTNSWCLGVMPRGCLGHVLQEGVCFTDFSLRVDAFRNPGDPGSENHLLDVQKPVHGPTYCWWTKSCTTKDDIYRGFNHPRWCRISSIKSMINYLSTGS